jgi:hypothetical protein
MGPQTRDDRFRQRNRAPAPRRLGFYKLEFSTDALQGKANS